MRLLRGAAVRLAVAVRIAAVLVPFYALYAAPPGTYPPLDAALQRVHALWAAFGAAALRLTGVPARSEGDTIAGIAVPLRVVRGCDGAEPLALLAAGLCAVPAPARARLAGLAAGAAVVLPLNALRIVSLALAAPHVSPETFDRLHLHLWQGLIVLAVVWTWSRWARNAARRAGMP